MWRFGANIRKWLVSAAQRHPMLAAALVTAGSIAAADCHRGWGLAVSMVAAAVAVRYIGWRTGLVWFCCGWLAVGIFSYRENNRQVAERALVALPASWVRAKVLEDGQGSRRYWSAPARLLDGDFSGVTVWWEGSGEVPVAGAVVASRGEFESLQEPRNPGEFDRAAWLRRQGVAATCRADWQGGTVATGRLAAWGAWLRQGFRRGVTAGLTEGSMEAAVVRAVVIGEKPPDAADLVAAFRNSGTLHVFSVSGLHVAMVASLGWWLLSWLGVSRRWAVVGLLPVIFGYSWLTGNSAPAVRSAWMAAVFLGAFVWRRRPDLLNALGVVLLGALLWDGRLLFLPGVQLSYGVVAAIAVGTAWTAKAFGRFAEPELYLPVALMNRRQLAWLQLRRWAAGNLSVSLAAGVGSTPLAAWHFGLVTPVAVAANLVLVPLVFVLLAVALTAAAVFPVATPLARGLNRMNGYVAKGCVAAAEAFAAIPGGHFQLGRERGPALRVYDLPHGCGAACFSDGSGTAVLLDCGDQPSFKGVVAPSLRRLGIEPDAVVLSHPDGDHLGGGGAVWEAFPIRQVLLPVQQARSPSYRAWLDSGNRAGIRLHPVVANESIPLPDGARLEVLHAPDPLAQHLVADDRVAVFRLHWRGWKLLLTSDAGMRTEQQLLATGKDLAADVIIAGRHRTDLSLGDPFLAAVNPQAIVVSNSAFPPEEQPPADAMAYWRSRGIQVIDQGEAGGVTLRVDAAGTLQLEGFLSAVPVTLTKPR